MRVTEHIDALDIMGVNSASYLILPKVVAGVFIVPFLVVLSMVLGVGAGAWIGVATGLSPWLILNTACKSTSGCLTSCMH